MEAISLLPAQICFALPYSELMSATPNYPRLPPATPNYPLGTQETSASYPTTIYGQFQASSLLCRVFNSIRSGKQQSESTQF